MSPLAAQLGGTDLVVLLRGELRDYDTATGVLQHSWPLPDVPAGRDCAFTNTSSCPYPAPALVLQDAAHGLATYTLDGHVHVLRLADGKDAIVASGTLARFTNAGLVYADGARIHLVPYDQLPLR